jgi:hypothetical protein
VPISSYRACRQFFWAGIAGLLCAAFSIGIALRWPWAWSAVGLLFASSGVVLFFALRPAIEIFESHLKIGGSSVPWAQIRRVDRSLNVPLVVQLTMADKTRVLICYPGDPDSSGSLLRHLRRFSREALIEGIPYRQFWGETAAPKPRVQAPTAHRPLLLPEDEAEVERMFQRLKAVGHLDPKKSGAKKSGEDK